MIKALLERIKFSSVSVFNLLVYDTGKLTVYSWETEKEKNVHDMCALLLTSLVL